MSNLSLLSGNLTRDPEIRYLKDGTACATFGLAVDRRWQDRESGEWAEATSFFDVACWRELAEHVALSIRRGSRVLVSGRLEQRSWTGEDGRLRSRVELVADDVGCSLRFAALDVPGDTSLSEPAF
jgi:single-strand DNA-binding protein